ncbi:hypothetical protein QR680_016540 [Steinernema hermaphroditum]|uniref:Activin types I and II receptor domain-containing protein n=1 Tax=Steinernema hermaphroditum TaxID=289476 RepID=A0AA39HBJ2_9BILA|nr:hypothetical protein QR680_016540 [Steinernema hermaphroditum]
MNRNVLMIGWSVLAALLSVLAVRGQAVDIGNCLKTVGAVPYNFDPSSDPEGARTLSCYFNKSESCYSFIPHHTPESVEYGCGKIDVDDLPEKCNETSTKGLQNICMEKAYHNGEKGKLCCCAGDMCNIPVNSIEILPTTTTTTTTTTTRAPATAPPKRETTPQEIQNDDWWQAPLIAFVALTLLAIFVVIAVLIYILGKIKKYRNQQMDLTASIDKRLKDHTQKVAEETRESTVQNFRSLVNQYHAARRAKRQEMIQKQLETGTQSQITAVTVNPTTDQTQTSMDEAEKTKASSKASSRILGCLPRNPCSSAKAAESVPTPTTQSEVSLSKLPRVEHV